MTDNPRTEGDRRAARRRERIASGWKRDDRYERMQALYETDPERFEEIYGARGALHLGLYESGKAAAAGEGPDDAA